MPKPQGPVGDDPSGPVIHNPERMRVALPLGTMAVMLAAVLGAGWKLNDTYRGVTHQLERLEERMADQVATKSDLAELKREITSGMGRRLREARVRCPRFVLRGSEMVVCAIEFEYEDGKP